MSFTWWHLLLTAFAAFVAGGFVCRRLRRISSSSLTELIDVFDHAPIGVVFLSKNGKFINVNSRFCQMLGYEREELIDQDVSSLTHPDDVGMTRKKLERWNRRRGSGGQFTKRFQHKNGSTVWVNIATRLHEESTGSRFFVSAVSDITELVNATNALRDSETRFRQLAENVPGVIYLCRNDERYTMLYLNDEVEELTGHSKSAFLGDEVSFVDLYHPDDAPPIVPIVMKALQERRPFELEYRLQHKDGHYVWVQEIGVGVFDENEELQFLEGFLANITERKLAERKQTLIMRELNHRVKNNLATVVSIVAQTFDATQEPAAFREAINGRIQAMAAAHELFARNEWADISVHELVEHTVAPYQGADAQRAAFKGDSVELPPEIAQTIHMTLHELATNAAKYGAWSVPHGNVDINWFRNNGELALAWKERGGPRIEAPDRRGYGLDMITGIIEYELEGQVSFHFDPTGLHCTICFPMPST